MITPPFGAGAAQETQQSNAASPVMPGDIGACVALALTWAYPVAGDPSE